MVVVLVWGLVLVVRRVVVRMVVVAQGLSSYILANILKNIVLAIDFCVCVSYLHCVHEFMYALGSMMLSVTGDDSGMC